MRVLVIQNFDDTILGQVGVALAEASAEIDHRIAYKGDDLPKDASGHDALVVLGGGQNALDDEAYPYIPPLLDLMRDFTESGRSVLGICLGSQLLARAYGGDNLLGTAPEFGWRKIALTQEGAADPFLGAVAREFRSFQWHDDTFTLPEGAVRLAGNEVAQNQAFRIGRAAYGVQFHFEADTTLVERWSDRHADFIATKRPDWTESHGQERTAYGFEADRAGLTLARAWVATIPAGMAQRSAA